MPHRSKKMTLQAERTSLPASEIVLLRAQPVVWLNPGGDALCGVPLSSSVVGPERRLRVVRRAGVRKPPDCLGPGLDPGANATQLACWDERGVCITTEQHRGDSQNGLHHMAYRKAGRSLRGEGSRTVGISEKCRKKG